MCCVCVIHVTCKNIFKNWLKKPDLSPWKTYQLIFMLEHVSPSQGEGMDNVLRHFFFLNFGHTTWLVGSSSQTRDGTHDPLC